MAQRRDAGPSWVVYGLAKGVFRTEQRVRADFGVAAGDDPTVTEELFAWQAMLEGYENSLEGDGEEAGPRDPFLEGLLEVHRSGSLHGWVLFEVIHKHYGAPLESLTTEQSKALDQYLSAYVLERIDPDS